MAKRNGTRDKIMHSAMRLFSKYGYNQVSLNQIAKDVGIRSSSIYNHFSCKEDIVDSIFEQAEEYHDKYRILPEELLKRLDTASPEEILMQYLAVQQYVDPDYSAELHRFLLIQIFHSTDMQKRLKDMMLTKQVASIQAVLQALIDKGAIPPCDAEALAEIWTRCGLVCAMLYNHDTGILPWNEYAALNRMMVQIAVRGVPQMETAPIIDYWNKHNNTQRFHAVINSQTKILWESALLFGDKGFKNTTMKDIAEKSGMRSSSLYNHYVSKADIFNALMDIIEARSHSFQADSFCAYIQHRDINRLLQQISSKYPSVDNATARALYRIIFREQFLDNRVGEFYSGRLVDDCKKVEQAMAEMKKSCDLPDSDHCSLARAYVYTLCSITVISAISDTSSSAANDLRVRCCALLASHLLHGFIHE